jgi:hypothetical protein
MKSIRIVLAVLGALFVVAVFLPFLRLGDMSLSLWKLREIKGGPTWIVLMSAMGILACVGTAMRRGALTRGLAIGATVASTLVALIPYRQFGSQAPLFEVGGIGAKILVLGGLLSLVAGIVAIARPERRLAA